MPFNITCRVTLLHSIADNVSPYKNSILLAKLIQSENIDIILRKNSDHRMSDDASIELLKRVVHDHLS